MKQKATKLLQVRITPKLMRQLHARRKMLDMTMKKLVTTVMQAFANTVQIEPPSK